MHAIRNRRTRQLLASAALIGSAAAAPSALAGTFRTITIDGGYTDWTGVPVATTDPTGDGNPIDYGQVQIANDDSFIYLHVSYATPVNPNAGPSTFLAFDTDNNVGTGFNIYGLNVVGSEAGYQNDFPFDQRGGFNSGGINGAASISPYFATTTDQEYAIPRNATYANDNALVFGNTSFTLMLWTDSGVAADTTVGLPYTFATNSPTWILNGSGDWQNPGNWGGTVPNGVGSLATFGNAITSNQTVFTNTAVTVGTLSFDNPNTYVLTGAGSLTLQVASGSAQVDVLNGTQKVNLPLTIASNTTFNVAAGATLKISDPMTVNAGRVVTQTGAGTVTYESIVNVLTGGGLQMGSSSHMAALNIAASASGSLTVGGNKVVKTDSLFVAATGTLDLNDNDLIVGGATPKSAVEALVKNARNGGAWNQPGITSTSARTLATTGLGVLSGAEYNSAGGAGVFSGQSYAASDTLVKYTWNGDANLDGRVTFDDYVKIDTGFNTHLTGWLNGDFNYSGAVNFDDYVLIDIAFNQQNGTLGRAIDWISGDDRSGSGRTATGVSEVIAHLDQFGAAYGQAFLAAVPEPSAFALLGVPALAGIARRRRVK